MNELSRPARASLWIGFLGLLLIFALRLTMTETAFTSISQILAKLQAAPTSAENALPDLGPAVTLGLCAFTCLFATLIAVGARLTWRHLLRLLIILIIAGGVLWSSMHAANRFVAFVGFADLTMCLLAGWGVWVACGKSALSLSAQRLMIAFLLAVTATWVAKGIYQRFSEIPDTIAYYEQHRDEALKAQGLSPDSPETTLFESRMHSREVTGFITLSNVMGAGMIGLTTIGAGLLAAGIITRKKKEAATGNADYEISPTALALGGSALLLLATLIVTFLTESRGGSVLALGGAIAIAVGTWKRNLIVRHRRLLTVAIAALLLLGAAGVTFYGIQHDRLPTKSLMFRWHYWTGAETLIKDHPWRGVGLNNFGDYYTSVKRASSPEDVKDPHSFFVRLAAECGLPVTLGIAALIACSMLSAGFGRRSITPEAPAHAFDARLFVIGGVAFCAMWWIAHFLIAETDQSYFAAISAVYAIVAAAAWFMTSLLLEQINEDAASRTLGLFRAAALFGALGMLVYDQINMAVVTGPVAMLFWVLLGLSESGIGSKSTNSTTLTPLRRILAGIALGGMTLAIAGWLWIPTLQNRGPGDVEPAINAYGRALQIGDTPSALAALNSAITDAPRSIELRRQHVLLNLREYLPVADEVRTILSLDKANARLHIQLAELPTDLPTAERSAILQNALHLDAQLADDEPKRLKPQELQRVQSEIEQLNSRK